MIKGDFPLIMIDRVLRLFTNKAIGEFYDKDGKSIIFYSIYYDNVELTRDIINCYSVESFYRRTTEGTYTL